MESLSKKDITQLYSVTRIFDDAYKSGRIFIGNNSFNYGFNIPDENIKENILFKKSFFFNVPSQVHHLFHNTILTIQGVKDAYKNNAYNFTLEDDKIYLINKKDEKFYIGRAISGTISANYINSNIAPFIKEFDEIKHHVNNNDPHYIYGEASVSEEEYQQLLDHHTVVMDSDNGTDMKLIIASKLFPYIKQVNQISCIMIGTKDDERFKTLFNITYKNDVSMLLLIGALKM